MLNTTFNKCHEAGACPKGYRKLAKALGGVDKYGKDTPIPLSKIVESNGLLDAIWTLRCTLEPSENIQIEFACRCAEHVLHFYEDKYPDDNRPRKAIEKARACITDKSQAAREVAWAAARVAWAAAWAARAAADAARAAEADEREWQKQTFLELLNQ
ncbi:MAG: putative immunity protein [Candidatus Cloacimonadaceae bacterium]